MNAQFAKFKSKLCKQNRHVDCSKQWEGLGFVAVCECICHKKKGNDVSSNISGSTSIIPLLGHNYEQIML